MGMEDYEVMYVKRIKSGLYPLFYRIKLKDKNNKIWTAYSTHEKIFYEVGKVLNGLIKNGWFLRWDKN